MYARFSTFDAPPMAMDDAISFCRDDAMTALQHIAGFVGLSMLVDRVGGQCQVTSAWKDEAAMRASAERAAPIRQRMGELLQAHGQAEVEEYEICLMHRAHRAPTSAHVRGIWCRMEPGMIDDALETFRMSTLSSLEEFDGFCSATVFCQRDTGRCCISIGYDTLDAFEAVRDEADALRMRTMSALDIQIERAGEYELAVARFHVPELV